MSESLDALALAGRQHVSRNDLLDNASHEGVAA